MSNWIFYNDEFLPADKPVLHAGNRMLQYGDGLFETMRVHNGSIVLGDHHFDRLRNGLSVLMMDDIDKNYLRDAVLKLCAKNEMLASARVRLSVFRDRGMIIESWPLESGYVFKTSSFVLDVFDGAKKSNDPLANSKTAAYLPYSLAGIYSRKNGFDDCLVRNNSGNVCDSSIANVFYIKDRQVYTPSLDQGCINGVMRRHIINHFPVKEKTIGLAELHDADEIFLTNVIRGIQPVTRFINTLYQIDLSLEIFYAMVKPLTS